MPDQAKEEVKEQYVPFFPPPPTLLPVFLKIASTSNEISLILTHPHSYRFESSAKDAKPESDKFGVGGTA